MNLFTSLGFRWDRSAISIAVPSHKVERACFRFYKMLPEFVWDASVLEGNPLTFVEVKTLLDGAPIGARKTSDKEQVLNLGASSKCLLAMIKSAQFSLSKPVFTELNGIVTSKEGLAQGVFREQGADQMFNEGTSCLQACEPFERAIAFFLFGALQRFFFSGNKRTSQFMMNGVLMSHGIDAISVPAAKSHEFHEKMGRFYQSRDATEMMAFLAVCHPDWVATKGRHPHSDD
jgi:hypothetical protein